MAQSRGESPHELVEREVLLRVENNAAWPAKPLKFEMEKYEIYQNTTGVALDRSEQLDKETIDKIPFYFKPSTTISEIKASSVYRHTEQTYEFVDEIGEFANLVAYVTLCNIYDELEGYLQPFSLYPENSAPMILSHTTRIPDGMIQFPTEYVPVEVYNGMDYLNDQSDKWDQLHDLSTEDEDMSVCSPILINRRSESGGFKHDLRKQNVTVIDTDCAFCSINIFEKYEESLNFLNITNRFEVIPGLTGANDEKLFDVDYDLQSIDEASNEDDDRAPEEQRQARLTPPREMLSDIALIPTQYCKRVRGGIQLHYVTTLYRQASGPAQRAGALVIQQMYNNLLRADRGVPQSEAIDAGYRDAKECPVE